MKLNNLLSCDKQITKKGRKGLNHGGKYANEVYEEYNENLENLEDEYRRIMLRYGLLAQEANDDYEMAALPFGKDIVTSTKIRRGQSFYRQTILTAYDHQCCITGIAIEPLLIASHIKPWKDSDPATERTNPRNGLCLNAFHDRAFDKGLLTLDNNYKIMISSQLKYEKLDETAYDWLFGFEGKVIRIPESFLPDKRFLEWHRDVVFEKN